MLPAGLYDPVRCLLATRSRSCIEIDIVQALVGQEKTLARGQEQVRRQASLSFSIRAYRRSSAAKRNLLA
jgi:hypothetical protein